MKAKLAKAIELVAPGDPRRLRQRVSDLAEHLVDANELVRNHICMVLVVIGCEYPDALANTREERITRLDDDNTFVRGRPAELLGVCARGDSEKRSRSVPALQSVVEDEERADDALDGVGTVGGIEGTTGEIATEISTPESDGECPHCGLELPEDGPPICPRCGAPN